MTSYIEEAEKNIINKAVELREALKLFSALVSFGNRYCRDYGERDNYQKGLKMMRDALMIEYSHACMNLVAFSASGGAAAKQFCQGRFKEYFSEEQRFAVMQFLTKNGDMPGSWMVNDENQFRKEARELIDSWEGVAPK